MYTNYSDIQSILNNIKQKIFITNHIYDSKFIVQYKNLNYQNYKTSQTFRLIFVSCIVLHNRSHQATVKQIFRQFGILHLLVKMRYREASVFFQICTLCFHHIVSSAHLTRNALFFKGNPPVYITGVSDFPFQTFFLFIQREQLF